MSRKTNAFQDLVTVVEKLMAGEGVTVQGPIELPDPLTGDNREIDILVEGRFNGVPVTVAIECRDHQRNQEVGWIDALEGKYKNLPVEMVWAVSTTPFSNAAIRKAEGTRIRTFTFAQDGEFPARVGLPGLKIGVRTVRHKLAEIKCIFDPPTDALPFEALSRGQVYEDGKLWGTFAEKMEDISKTDFSGQVDVTSFKIQDSDLLDGQEQLHELIVTTLDIPDLQVEVAGMRYRITGILCRVRFTVQFLRDEKVYSYRGNAVTVSRVPNEDGSINRYVSIQDPQTPMKWKVYFAEVIPPPTT